MRLIVSGGRDFLNVPLLWKTLDAIHESEPDGVRLVAEGASDDVTGPYMGADYWAHQWALARQVPTVRVHADWAKFGKSAGPIRNGEMLKSCLPDRLVAFPGRRGTADMIRQAERAGIVIQTVALSPADSTKSL